MSDDSIKPIEPALSIPEVTNDQPHTQDEAPFGSTKRRHLYAAITFLLKKTLTDALFGQGAAHSMADADIAGAISRMHSLLVLLKNTDQNQSPHFAQELSENWHILLAISRGTPLDPLIDLINDYPRGESHSFGFYLTHYAGDSWLPFPFLEILKKLHQGYILRKKRSELMHMLILLEQAAAYFT